MSSQNTLMGSDGKPLLGYLNESKGKGRPSLVVIQEWWGVNAQIKGVVDRFAAAGFVAIAPDLYHGRIAATEDEASHLAKGLDWGKALEEIGAVLDGLRARDPQSPQAILGFCMGGAVAINAACAFPRLKACVSFYGLGSPTVEQLRGMKAKFLGHYANIDEYLKQDAISKFEKELLPAAGVASEVFHYDAHHAFFNEARPEVYSRPASDLAWERTLAFLKQAL